MVFYSYSSPINVRHQAPNSFNGRLSVIKWRANFLLKQSNDCQLKHDLELKNKSNLMSGQKENWKQNKSNKKTSAWHHVDTKQVILVVDLVPYWWYVPPNQEPLLNSILNSCILKKVISLAPCSCLEKALYTLSVSCIIELNWIETLINTPKKRFFSTYLQI